MAFIKGNSLNFDGTFDLMGVLQTPVSATLTITRPDGSEDVFAYPGPNVTEVSAGVLRHVEAPDPAGDHEWEWVGVLTDGSGTADSRSRGTIKIAD
jgi:hypothetical protein